MSFRPPRLLAGFRALARRGLRKPAMVVELDRLKSFQWQITLDFSKTGFLSFATKLRKAEPRQEARRRYHLDMA